MLQRRQNSILTCALVVLTLCILSAFVADLWLQRSTASGQRLHARWRASLPGVDLGLDTLSARPGRPGRLQRWVYLHNGDAVQTVFRLPGAPAVPVRGSP